MALGQERHWWCNKQFIAACESTKTSPDAYRMTDLHTIKQLQAEVQRDTNTTCRIVVHLHARRGNSVWNKSLRQRDCPQDDQTFQIWPVKSHMHSLYLFIHPGLRWSPRSFVIRVDIGFFGQLGGQWKMQQTDVLLRWSVSWKSP